MAQIRGHARSLGTDHELAGVLRPGSSIDRAAVWASALGGVLETDDLSCYLPDVFGDTRLARQTDLDLRFAGLSPRICSGIGRSDRRALGGGSPRPLISSCWNTRSARPAPGDVCRPILAVKLGKHICTRATSHEESR